MAKQQTNKSLNYARIMYRVLTRPRGWRLNDLYEDLGISDRTWRNYIKELKEIPDLLDERGESILEDVGQGEERLIRLRCDLPETGPSDGGFRVRLVVMHLARRMFGYLEGTPLGDEVEALLDHMQESFRDVDAVQFASRDADRKLHVVDGASKDYTPHADTIALLVEATLRQRVITMSYVASWNSTDVVKTHELEPLSLVSSRGALYLLARTRPDTLTPHDDSPPKEAVILTFAADRIQGLQVLAERFDYPSSEVFHPEDFFEGEFGLYQRHDNEAPIRVEVHFADIAWLKQYLQERHWHKTQRFEHLEDGKLKMTFEVSDMGSVWPWIRSFGDDIEVIEPHGPVPRNSEEQRAWRHARKKRLLDDRRI